jgi:hypothetical protein
MRGCVRKCRLPFGEFVFDHGEAEPELGQRLFDVGLLPFEERDALGEFLARAGELRSAAVVFS